MSSRATSSGLPFRTAAEGGGFDLVYSIGVLHHLPDPARGLPEPRCATSGPAARSPSGSTGTRTTASSGTSSSRSDGSRRESRRPCSAARLAARARVPRRREGRLPAAPRNRRRDALPLDEYLTSVADFSFRQNYGIVFDQLVAPTAAYIKGAELEGWFAESGLEDVRSRIGTETRGAAAAGHPADGGQRERREAARAVGLPLVQEPCHRDVGRARVHCLWAHVRARRKRARHGN